MFNNTLQGIFFYSTIITLVHVKGNDFENDEIQMEVCCPSGKEIPQCDSESIEINDMIDLLPKILKSLEDAGLLLYWSIQLLFVGFLIKYVS
jgi:hypothetical protein